MKLKDAIERLSKKVEIEHKAFDIQLLTWLKELQTYRESEQEYISEEDKLKCELITLKFKEILDEGFEYFELQEDIFVRGSKIEKGTVVKIEEFYNDTAPLFRIIPSDDLAYIDVEVLKPLYD